MSTMSKEGRDHCRAGALRRWARYHKKTPAGAVRYRTIRVRGDTYLRLLETRKAAGMSWSEFLPSLRLVRDPAEGRTDCWRTIRIRMDTYDILKARRNGRPWADYVDRLA